MLTVNKMEPGDPRGAISCPQWLAETLGYLGEAHAAAGRDTEAIRTLERAVGLAIFDYLFLGSDSPTCLESADTNNDATIDISDGIATLQYLFNGGPPPAAPGPPEAPCGLDVDEPGSAGDLGCEAYPPCR